MVFLCLKLQSQNVGVVKSLLRNTPPLRDHRERYRQREVAPVADGLSHRSQRHAGHVEDYDRGSEASIRRAFPTRYDRWHRASGHTRNTNEVTHQAKNDNIMPFAIRLKTSSAREFARSVSADDNLNTSKGHES
jgi:hypothetical protein